jgi:hypothetical protein
MVHRSAPQQTLADRYFPVRVRIAVPPTGFGAKLDRIYPWLGKHAGPDGYFVGAQTRVGMADAAVLYFMHPAVAAAFVEEFGCELVVGREPPAPKGVRRQYA